MPTKVYATVEDVPALQTESVVAKYRLSTVAEYHAAAVDHAKNPAGEQMDAGREPYLVNLEAALVFGTHPYVEVHDVMIDRSGEDVGIEVLSGTKWLPPNTILAWQ